MTTHDRDPVLVTGASGGIGRAVVVDLLTRGHTVVATARRRESIADLAEAGATTLALDVTDESSMAAAVAAGEGEHGHIGTLVNNAGYGEYGAVEEVPMDAVRRQFETNVFGLARLTQLVLPGMRRAGRGRVVNIGSMGGRITFPAGGYYHVSKYALEAISDALRVEVAPFGIDVVLVEPGLIRTGFGGVAALGLAASEAGGESVGPGGRSPYADLRRRADRVMEDGYRGPFAVTPDRVAVVVGRAIEARRRARATSSPRRPARWCRCGGSAATGRGTPSCVVSSAWRDALQDRPPPERQAA